MRTLASALLLVVLAACRIKGDPTTDAATASCSSVGFGCGQNADCCSFACVGATCVPNPVVGGLCRTSDDCIATMTCISGQCTPGATCRSTYGGPGVGDTCTSNNMCCSGNCVGENNTVYPPIAGTCDVNHPPVVTSVGPAVQPFYATTTLTALASDPDAGDTLQYVWRLQTIPAGSALTTAWASSAVHPSVFLDVPGTYVFQVTVKDGFTGQNGRLSASGTVTISAVNLPPVVDAGADVASLLRNTSLSVSGTVFDPNLGATTVRCAWYAKPPGRAEVLLQAFPSCPSYAPTTGYTATTTFHPGIDEPQGDWTLRLEAFDGQYLTSDTRTVTVVNAAPVADACPGCAAPPYARVVNLHAAGDPTPASIGLSGTATDQNGDVGTPGFTWSWAVEEQGGVPLVDPLVLATGDGTSPPFAATFEPAAVGTYAAVLRLDDGHGGTAASTVVVRVEPFLRPLHPVDLTTGLPFGGDVVDAAYVHAADRIVYVGSDDASGTRIWLVDPESAPTTPSAYVALGRTPVALALDPGGAVALVGEAGGFERFSLTGGLSSSGSAVPVAFTLNDVLDAGQREYAFTSAGQVYELSSAGTGCPHNGCATVGTRGVATTDTLWALDEATGIVRRYAVQPNSDLVLGPSVTSPTASSDLWLSAPYGPGGASRDVVVSGGARFDATGLTPATPSLPFPARHLDTTAVATDIRGVAVSSLGTEVRTIGAAWASPAANALPLPMVGYQGTGYATTARFAFVRTDGSTYYVALRALVNGRYRWYLMRY
jgi:hypothetical protein